MNVVKKLREVAAAARRSEESQECRNSDGSHIFPFMVKDPPYPGCEDCLAADQITSIGRNLLLPLAEALVRSDGQAPLPHVPVCGCSACAVLAELESRLSPAPPRAEPGTGRGTEVRHGYSRKAP